MPSFDRDQGRDACLASPCGANSTCAVLPAPTLGDAEGWTCTCNTGFEGEAAAGCTDIDACLLNPCGTNVACTDLPAPALGDATGRTCACKTGFEGDPVSECTDINACWTHFCGAHATCTDLAAPALGDASGRTCRCFAGYEGDPAVGCTNIDDCTPNPCPPRATCTDGVDTYACTCLTGYSGLDCAACAAGYEGDAVVGCTDIDDCTPDPCLNGGSCTDGIETYTCSCLYGYGGTNCETPLPCGVLEQACPSGYTCDIMAAVGTHYLSFCVNMSTNDVWVPTGTFWMGCNTAMDANCDPDEYPQHLVELSAYAVDRTEVTAAAYKACVVAGWCTPLLDTPEPFDDGTYGLAERQAHPINYVTWDQATVYCAWQDKRLCTAAEWERAARGGCETVTGGSDTNICKVRMRIYPWDRGDGSAPIAPTCNLANFAWSFFEYCPGETAATAPAGSRPAGASPYGALNMAGNVLEFVNDWYIAYPGSTPLFDHTNEYREGRGGSFYSDAVGLRPSYRYYAAPGDSYGSLGFRCCRSL